MNTDRCDALRLGFDPPRFELGSKQDKGGIIMQPKHSIKSDEDALFTWRKGLGEVASEELEEQLFQREGELLPRFAAHYDDLKRLPRRVRRSVQRHWRRSLAGIALLFALGTTPVMAATINVGGACTLVRAMVAANNDTTATGHCTKGSGADRIVMQRNSTVTLAGANNTNYGPTGLPTIRSVITIDGNGSIIRRRHPATNFRILAVGQEGDLTLQETRVTGGLATRGNASGGGLCNFGILTVTRSTISGNTARSEGGGVWTFRQGALTVIASTISGNTAGREGGGLSIGYRSTAAITNSTISGNTAGYLGSGGGMDISSDSNVTLTNSNVSGNTAGRDGGGVSNDESTLSLINSSISGNTASSDGGGVSNSFTYNSNLRVINSTISGNKGRYGGGVINGYKAAFSNSTISGNSATGSYSRGGGVFNGGDGALTTLSRVLISGNNASSGREVFNGADDIITAENFNLFGHKGETSAQAVSGFAPGVTDITASSDGNTPTALARILNTTLANNGGPTRTHALVAGSPAVDSVNDGTCPPPGRDQHGVRRPQDGNGDGGVACDTGSFERR